jgi:hypothetical protein
MKNCFLTLLLTAICSVCACAQLTTDQVQYSKGKIIYHNQRVIKPKEIGPILLQNPSPAMPQYIKKYKTNNGMAAAFAGLGGGAVGFSLGSAIGGGKINTGVIGTGMGGILIGVLFDSFARKNLKLAVNTYNIPYQSPVPNESSEK